MEISYQEHLYLFPKSEKSRRVTVSRPACFDLNIIKVKAEKLLLLLV